MPRDDDRRGRDRDDRDDRRGRDRDDRGDDRRGRDRDDRGGSRGRDRDDRGRRDDDQGSGSGRSYNYRARTVEEVKERASKGARDYDKLLKPGIKTWSPEKGENRIRLLPPSWDGAKHYGLDVLVHYGIGPDRDSYICPREQPAGDPCPICEERDAERRNDRPDEEYVKELEAKRRALVYLVDRNDEKEGVQAWLMPWTLDKDIIKVSIDKDTGEVLPIDHPEEGYDVIFDKTGEKRATKYDGVSVSRRPSPLGKPAWLDYALDNPLPEQLQVYDYDHIAKAFGAKGQQRDTRGSNDRDRDDRDDRRDRDDDRRGSSRDRDDPPPRRGRSADDEPTWASVHDMTRTELEDLIEQKRLDIKPSQAKDDEDLADWVCEDLKLKKEEAARRRAVTDDRGSRDRERDEPRDRDRDDKDDRLREMTRRRERD